MWETNTNVMFSYFILATDRTSLCSLIFHIISFSLLQPLLCPFSNLLFFNVSSHSGGRIAVDSGSSPWKILKLPPAIRGSVRGTQCEGWALWRSKVSKLLATLQHKSGMKLINRMKAFTSEFWHAPSLSLFPYKWCNQPSLLGFHTRRLKVVKLSSVLRGKNNL